MRHRELKLRENSLTLSDILSSKCYVNNFRSSILPRMSGSDYASHAFVRRTTERCRRSLALQKSYHSPPPRYIPVGCANFPSLPTVYGFPPLYYSIPSGRCCHLLREIKYIANRIIQQFTDNKIMSSETRVHEFALFKEPLFEPVSKPIINFFFRRAAFLGSDAETNDFYDDGSHLSRPTINSSAFRKRSINRQLISAASRRTFLLQSVSSFARPGPEPK